MIYTKATDFQSKFNIRVDSMRQIVFAAILWGCVYAPSSFAQDANIFTPDEFAVLVKRLSYNPDDLLVGDQLREHCRRNNTTDKCIESINALTEKYPKNKFLRYHAALAYVDKVPGHTLFRQGWLSSRSMDHVTEVLRWDPEDWAARYIRGLNGLYWPKSFRKLPKAIEDLKYCVRTSKDLPSGLVRPYHALAYIALGDALVKSDDPAAAALVYQDGAKIFRESKELAKRIAMSSDELLKFIAELRQTDSRVDTEISFLIDGGQDKI